HGIDWDAVAEAIDDYEEEGRLRGASTITMQVARNLFLWPGGGFARKAIEAPIALAIDFFWPKRRIIEVYLNIAEWGEGIYGAEAAARAYF
ncbi:biosynthetic peptidoglycan transglycosylase, partial [Acinetobacter baumannii]